MRDFFKALLRKAWLLLSLGLVPIPKIVRSLLTDEISDRTRGVFRRSEVTEGIVTVLSVVADHPVSTAILLALLIVAAGAVYSAFEVRRQRLRLTRGTAEAVASASGELAIAGASWVTDSDPDKYTKVDVPIRACIKNGRIDVTVTPELLGLKDDGRPHFLKVAYRIGTLPRKEIVARQGDRLVLPEQESPPVQFKADLEGSVTVTILEAVIGKRELQNPIPEYLLLRIRVLAHKPGQILNSWKLTLYNSDGIYAHTRLSNEDVVVCLGKPMDCYNIPGIARIDNSNDPLLHNSEQPGLLLFRVSPLKLDDPLIVERIFGCDFKLSVYDSDGRPNECTKRPGPWLCPARYAFEQDSNMGTPGAKDHLPASLRCR